MKDEELPLLRSGLTSSRNHITIAILTECAKHINCILAFQCATTPTTFQITQITLLHEKFDTNEIHVVEENN